MSEQRVYKDFIDGVETETNTEGCTTVKLNDGKTYQTYPYPGFGFVGNSCGLYIQKATPATTEAKKQLWFDIPPPEEGKEPIVTKIVIEDRSSLSEDSLKLFDDYISKYTNDKTPNEILEILNISKDFKVLNKKGTEYRKIEEAAPAQAAPAPVVEAPKESSTQPDIPKTEHKHIDVVAQLVTDKEGSVDILRLKKLEVNDDKSADMMGEQEEELKNMEIINKDNFGQKFCNQIVEEIKNSNVKDEFNKSAADVKMAQEDIETIKNREKGGKDLIWKTSNQVLSNIEIFIKQYDSKQLKTLQNNLLNETKNNYEQLRDNINIYKDNNFDYNNIQESLSSLPNDLKTGIIQKICGDGCVSLDKNQFYNFLISVKNNLLGLIEIINKINKALDQQHILVQKNTSVLRNLVSSNKSIETKEVAIAETSIPKELNRYYFTARYFKVNTKSLETSMTHKERKESRDKLKSSIINRGKSVGKSFMSLFPTRKSQPDPNAAAPTTTGGKRKTRKNKARKTRRKVQRKRRQSKKH